MAERGRTHLDPLSRVGLGDGVPRDPTPRRAIARGRISMASETASLVARGEIPKGDVLSVARVAGIQAAKRAAELIPMCHPLLVGSVFVNFRIDDDSIEVEVRVEAVDRTGVEMEAMTACSVALLSIYDMCKSVDQTMVIGRLALWEKAGGRSGTYRRTAEVGPDLASVDGWLEAIDDAVDG